MIDWIFPSFFHKLVLSVRRLSPSHNYQPASSKGTAMGVRLDASACEIYYIYSAQTRKTQRLAMNVKSGNRNTKANKIQNKTNEVNLKLKLPM